MNELLRLVREMVLAVVDEPEGVSITANDGVVFVKVARGDVGKVIGKQGRTVRSLRTIMAAKAKKTRLSFELNVYEYDREEVKP